MKDKFSEKRKRERESERERDRERGEKFLNKMIGPRKVQKFDFLQFSLPHFAKTVHKTFF